MTLLESTKKLLKSRLKEGATLRDIAADCGEVGFEWIRKFHDGSVKNPTVTRVQSLHDFLLSKKNKSSSN